MTILDFGTEPRSKVFDRVTGKSRFGQLGKEPRIAMEIGSREAIREAAIRGLGIGTVSESEYVADEQLHPLPIAGAPVVTHIYVCCLRERRRSRIIAAFFDTLHQAKTGKG